MRAPTLWEEGRLSASRVVRLAVLAGVLTLALDLVVNGHLTAVFDVAFVLVCLAAVLAIRPADFGTMALLPPLLVLAAVLLLAGIESAWVAEKADGYVQAVVSGLTHRATGLAVGYGLVLAVLLVRMRVQVVRAQERAQDRAEARRQAQRSGSPAPTRTTSG